jgi:hypothetical protein
VPACTAVTPNGFAYTNHGELNRLPSKTATPPLPGPGSSRAAILFRTVDSNASHWSSPRKVSAGLRVKRLVHTRSGNDIPRPSVTAHGCKTTTRCTRRLRLAPPHDSGSPPVESTPSSRCSRSDTQVEFTGSGGPRRGHRASPSSKVASTTLTVSLCGGGQPLTLPSLLRT